MSEEVSRCRFQYLPLALLLCAVSVSGSSHSFREASSKFMSNSLSVAEPTQVPPPEIEEPKKQEVEGEDPARAVEKQAAKDAVQAAKDVPTTMPPKQDIRDEEADEAGATAAEITGVKPNKHGDFATFSWSFTINVFIVLVCVIVFCCLRKKFPIIYSGNVVCEPRIAPCVPSDSCFGWISAVFNTSIEEAAHSVGLDSALLLEFFNVCVVILALIGTPLVTVLCPLHYYFGGAGMAVDQLSSIAMGNVMMRHPWMYYIHAITVNFVTIAIVQVLYKSMQRFVVFRYAWLKSMPGPRCVTVLMEGIPPAYQSDERLHEFIAAMFHPDSVVSATMVKKAPELKSLFEEQKQLRASLEEQRDLWDKVDKDPEQRPMTSESLCFGPQVDAIKYYEDKLAELDPKVDAARKEALENAKLPGEAGGNTSSGFVTFAKKRQKEVCLNMTFTPVRTEWVASSPPPASDVLWDDLKQRETMQTFYTVLAYACVISCYLLFLPICFLGTNLSETVKVGFFQPIWDSFAPSLALMLCLGFLPTIFLLIFRSFFTLKADTFAQHLLQKWYYFFNLFFVILVTIIGRNLAETMTHILRKPEMAMELMADNMPNATHFYMDFLMLQWGEQAVSLLRQVNLCKYLLWRCCGHEEERAKELAEPEDQDYYGIGARSARFTVNMLVGIVFSTLSPLIALLALILFLIKRLFYGYLIVFAETKKPDLGGVFFHQQLEHLFVGCGIYNILMIGVLGPSPIGRARTTFPMLISAPSLIYTIYHYYNFKRCFVWQDLPFTEVCFHHRHLGRYTDNGLRYIQPEFLTDAQQADMKKDVDAFSTTGDGTFHKDEKGGILKAQFRGAEGEKLEHPEHSEPLKGHHD